MQWTIGAPSLAPAGLPEPIRARLEAAARQAVDPPEGRALLAARGIESSFAPGSALGRDHRGRQSALGAGDPQGEYPGRVAPAPPIRRFHACVSTTSAWIAVAIGPSP